MLLFLAKQWQSELVLFGDSIIEDLQEMDEALATYREEIRTTAFGISGIPPTNHIESSASLELKELLIDNHKSQIPIPPAPPSSAKTLLMSASYLCHNQVMRPGSFCIEYRMVNFRQEARHSLP